MAQSSNIHHARIGEILALAESINTKRGTSGDYACMELVGPN